MTGIAGRHVVLGVSGGIACYKSCTLARRLTEAVADVAAILDAESRRPGRNPDMTDELAALGRDIAALADRLAQTAEA